MLGPKLECKLCLKLLKGKRDLLNHLQNEHKDFEIENYIDKFFYQRPKCGCGCGQLTKLRSFYWGFFEFCCGHWMKARDRDDVKEHLKNVKQTLKKLYKEGKIKTNKGGTLSIETKEKIRNTLKQSFKEGKYVAWRKGLTKENDECIRIIGQKASKTLKKKFQNGELKAWRTNPNHIGHQNWNNSHAKILKRKYELKQLIHWSQGLSKECNDGLFKRSDKQKLTINEIKNRILNLNSWFEVLEYPQTNFNPGTRIKLKIACLEHKHVQIIQFNKLCRMKKCKICYPNVSQPHYDILNFLKSLNIQNVIINDRQQIYPYELDVYIPDINFAIELNGLYWHCNCEDDEYHNKKSLMCFKKKISLFHIFEDEWNNNQDIVKSMIIHKLKLRHLQKIIYARNCNIKNISIDEANLFLKENYLDFNDINEINNPIALINNNEIVALITFNDDNIKYFCIKKYTHIPGAFSKLLSSINQNKIYFKHDTRFGTLNICDELCESNNQFDQNFWFTDKYIRFNKRRTIDDKIIFGSNIITLKFKNKNV